MDRFKVRVMPAHLPTLGAEQTARLNTFTAGGGIIIRAGKAEPGIAVRSDYAAGGPRLSLEPRGYVLGQLTRKPDGRTWILHLLNYDHQAPAEYVKVRLEQNGLVQDQSPWQVKVLSPDRPPPQFTGLSLHGCIAEFVLNRIGAIPWRLSRPIQGPRREAFRANLSSSEPVGANLSDRSDRLPGETTKCRWTTAESTTRRILYVGLANPPSRTFAREQSTPGTTSAHKCPTHARLPNLTIKFPFAPDS
jgi:hypothetical protein